MDGFSLLLLLLAAAMTALSAVAYASYPLVAVSFTALNRLTSTIAMDSTIQFDAFRHRNDGTGGDIAHLIITGPDVGLSGLPAMWLQELAATCVHDDIMFALFIATLSISSLHTLLALVLAWSTPSVGDIHDLKVKMARLAAEEALDEDEGLQPEELDATASPRAKFFRRLDATLIVSRVCQRTLIGTCVLLLGTACTSCALVFVTRRCVEEKMISFFHAESMRTRFVYQASSASWPGFLMCFVSVLTFCSLLCLIHWLGLNQCGPKRFDDAATVESERLSQMASSAASQRRVVETSTVVRAIEPQKPPPQLHKEQYSADFR
jgi:hypothetical protein